MMKIVLCAAVLLAAGSSFAQTKKVPLSDPDWGENQNIDKAMNYWSNWLKNGWDTTIPEARIKAYQEFVAMPRPRSFFNTVQSAPAWTQVGGSLDGFVSGRPTAIAFSKQHSGVMYLSTSGGGLYKTYAFGSASGGYPAWTFIDGGWATNALGGIAVDYTNDSIVYVGTGDMYAGNTDEYSAGDGIYKSTDGGLNWTQVATRSVAGSAINQIVLDPVTPTIVYATGLDGIRKSTNAGANWKHILTISGTTHMVIDPNNPQRIFAGGAGKIVLSTDGGATWSSDLASNISNKFTVTLGMSPKNSAIVYASIGSSSTGNSVGLAKSLDSGNTWSIVSNPAGGYMSQQAFYDNALAVSPNNPNYVSVGGLDIYSFKDGGSSPFNNTDWTLNPGDASYTHADIHVLQYGGGLLWALTDGGIYLSADNGGNWSSTANNSLSTLLFVGGDADAGFTYVEGGAQDNGVSRALTTNHTQFTTEHGGDGGRTFVSQTDGLTVYSTYVQAVLLKSNESGVGFDPGPNGDYNWIPYNSQLRNENAPFYMYYDVCESDAATLALVGYNNVYYSTDGCYSLANITNGKVPGPQTVHVPAADPTVIYVGTTGYTYVSRDAGSTWTKSSKSIGQVTDFCTDPQNAGSVWVSIAGNNHFAHSTDFGTTWQFPAMNNLPSGNYQSIARAPNGELFLGTTVGVMRSLDGGITWEALRDGMPIAQITKLHVRGSNPEYLLATTYGHGMYKIDITDLPGTVNSVPITAPAVQDLVFTSAYPNPVRAGSQATVSFSSSQAGWAYAKLYDALGHEVSTIANTPFDAGNHSIEFAAPSVAGTYWVVITQAGKTVSGKIVVE